jgi:DHA1 family tetracycline resistance protein-like MFS transporter
MSSPPVGSDLPAAPSGAPDAPPSQVGGASGGGGGSAPAGRAAIAFILVTVGLDVLALGVVIPVLPSLVLGFVAGDTARAATIYGLFVTVWEAVQLLMAPLLGALSDRFGRRPVVLLSNLGMGLDYVLMALAPSLGLLCLGRVISGATAASYSVAGAYIADVTPPEKRAAGFGMMGAAFGAGFVLGPALGGLLVTLHPRAPFWVAAALSLANWAYGLFVLPESLPKERRASFSWRAANPLGALALLRSQPQLLGLAVLSFLGAFAHFVYQSTFVLAAGHRFGWTGRDVGLCLAAVGVLSAIVQGGLVRVAVARLGERSTLVLGLGFGVLGFLVYGLAPTSGTFLLGLPLNALWGLSGPAAQGLMSARLPGHEQGRLQGALSGLMGVAGILAPPLFSATFAAAIAPGRALQLPGAPFLLSAAVLLVALVGALRVARGHARATGA